MDGERRWDSQQAPFLPPPPPTPKKLPTFDLDGPISHGDERISLSTQTSFGECYSPSCSMPPSDLPALNYLRRRSDMSRESERCWRGASNGLWVVSTAPDWRRREFQAMISTSSLQLIWLRRLIPSLAWTFCRAMRTIDLPREDEE